MIILTLSFVLIGLYGWLSAIGFGLSLLRLLPRMTLIKQALRMATPVWGVSNVLLAAALVTLAIFFRHDAEEVFALVQVPLLAGLGLLIIHSVLVIGLFYKNAKTGFRPANIAYVVTSFLLPLSFSLGAIRLVSGGQFWESALGWTALASLAFALAALAVTFAFYVVGHTPHDRLHLLSRWLNIVMAIAVVTGLLLTANTTAIHFDTAARIALAGGAIGIIVVQIIFGMLRRERYVWWYVSLFAIATPLLIALADQQNLLLLRH